MNDTTVKLVGGSGVTGNITDCKIENQLKSITRNSKMSLGQENTYITYDVCNREVIGEYTVPTWTGTGVFLMALISIIVVFVMIPIISIIHMACKENK